MILWLIQTDSEVVQKGTWFMSNMGLWKTTTHTLPQVAGMWEPQLHVWHRNTWKRHPFLRNRERILPEYAFPLFYFFFREVVRLPKRLLWKNQNLVWTQGMRGFLKLLFLTHRRSRLIPFVVLFHDVGRRPTCPVKQTIPIWPFPNILSADQ